MNDPQIYILPPQDDALAQLSAEWIWQMQQENLAGLLAGELEDANPGVLLRLQDHPNGNSRWILSWQIWTTNIPIHPARLGNYRDTQAFLDGEAQRGLPIDQDEHGDRNPRARTDPLDELEEDGQIGVIYSTDIPQPENVGFITEDHLAVVRSMAHEADSGHINIATMARLMDDQAGNAQWCTHRCVLEKGRQRVCPEAFQTLSRQSARLMLTFMLYSGPIQL